MKYRIVVMAVNDRHVGTYATIHPSEDAALQALRDAYELEGVDDDHIIQHLAEQENWVNLDACYIDTDNLTPVDIDPLDVISQQAYLEVMGSAGILGILWNRETVSTERLLALTADEVVDLYESYVGPAVDGIEDALLAEGNA